MKHDRKYLIPLSRHSAGVLKESEVMKLASNIKKEDEKQKMKSRLPSKTSIALAIVFLLLVLFVMKGVW